MAQVDDFKDFSIRWPGHNKYNSRKVIEDDAIEVIVQKLEMILFTNKTDVLGQDSYLMGCNLEYYLWQTKISNGIIKNNIVQQINKYVPELNIIGYDFALNIFEGTVRDIMELNFTIKGYNVGFLFQ